MFRPVESNVSFPELERRIIEFWKKNRIYEKSLAQREGCPEFVFYEGPPTANGLPHPGHCLTRAIKDLFPRYRTMRGELCRRKAGWDTHGLPVEVEVCKELGIHSKEEIESYGVEPFIHKCIESVFRYTKQWEELTERLGFWIHLDEAYVTYRQSYVESVWWALKNLFDRGLLYQGHKIVWWWAQGGTALSSGEVGQGYREVADPSVYVRFPLVDPPEALAGADLLVWTTTPWTLPSNQFVAVKPYFDYAVVEIEDEPRRLVMVAALVDAIAAKVGKQFTVKATMRGAELVGLRYVPPFEFYYSSLGDVQGTLARPKPVEAKTDEPEADDETAPADRTPTEETPTAEHVAWRVVPAEFVTTDSGTGLVHQAPAFGEVDYDLLLDEQSRFVAGEGPTLICSVGPDGRFTDETPEYQGRWVKEADRDICRQLRDEDKLFHQEQYLHDYPFCWRADEDPLIQYPRKSWFIRTTEFKDRMLENNQRINWLPEHIRDGRMGNFLETNVDWALSRERYWGTPLPIWVCEATGYMEAVASYDELLAKPGARGAEAWTAAKQANPNLPDDLKVHKPYIDQITYDSPKSPDARMRRVTEVIDCWFDSGAMPFAQWGYPGKSGSGRPFATQFPADFISEALDQTRGWFYSLLAISTLLFDGEFAEDMPLPDEREADPENPLPAPVAPAAPIAERSPETPIVPFPHPFRNCIVLGLMLGEDGQKMSKQKRNYRQPNEIFDRYGADALRWYLFSNQPPWTTIRFSEQAIKECIPEFLLRLWNCYSFFVIYANIDQFDPAARLPELVTKGRGRAKVEEEFDDFDEDVEEAPRVRAVKKSKSPAGQKSKRPTASQLTPDVLAAAQDYRSARERSEIDRWILSELHRTANAVTRAMDAYDNYGACARLIDFVDALSNWYVRSCRDRFWSGEMTADKADAYWTLYESLLTTTKLIAPFMPFLAEELWQNLAARPFGRRVAASVHLCDYPTPDTAVIDKRLSEQMSLAREIVSLGRSARMTARLKVRQPLARVEIILADAQHREWLEQHESLIRDELNVKKVEISDQAEKYIDYTVLPDLKRLGPKLGKRLPSLRQALAQADAGALLASLEADGQIALELPDGPVTLDRDDIQIRLQAKPGWAAAQGRQCVVVLSTELTPELVAEGRARELVRVIQDRRKEIGCEYTDRIRVGVVTESAELLEAAQAFADYIRGETLAVALDGQPIDAVDPLELKVAGFEMKLYVKIEKQS
ncbi:MAG TPA: isoleucine--tRNA ligase [Thermoguttaceae bacterium]|nr:isoleucine--tRNA ligase [Thermoguttaceae bacterium]